MRYKHKGCQATHDAGVAKIRSSAADVFASGHGLDSLLSGIQAIASEAYITNDEIRSLLLQSWLAAVDRFLEDGILDETEEARIVHFKEQFSFSPAEPETSNALTRIAKAGTIREVLNGVIPQRVVLSGDVAINFQKGEIVVWAFPATPYYEDKNRREYVGSSQGVSMRIAKGLYYRTGSFKGYPVDTNEHVHVDTGLVVLTNKNLYFAGQAKSLRVPYSKILTFQPFSDGIGIMRDATNAKPQTFVTGDGWFIYNLLTNLAKLG